MKKPRSLSDWQKVRSGSPDRREIPLSVFLGPNRTYPAKVWDGEKWVWSYRMLRAVISRANSQNKPAISRKAQRILHREFG